MNEISSSDTEHSPVVQPKPGARKSISRELANLAINSPAANIRSKKRESSGRPVLKPSRRKRSIEGLGRDDSDTENISDNMVPAAKLAEVEKKCQDLTNKLKVRYLWYCLIITSFFGVVLCFHVTFFSMPSI